MQQDCPVCFRKISARGMAMHLRLAHNDGIDVVAGGLTSIISWFVWFGIMIVKIVLTLVLIRVLVFPGVVAFVGWVLKWLGSTVPAWVEKHGLILGQ